MRLHRDERTRDRGDPGEARLDGHAGHCLRGRRGAGRGDEAAHAGARLEDPGTCVPGWTTIAESTGAAVLDRFFPDRQYDTVIHHSAKVMEGSWEWKPIVSFMPGNRAAQDYAALGKEMGLWDE